MGIQDLIITPIYLVIFTLIAYFIRPYVTNRKTRKYFLPALWLRFAGAIALGLIYQFYYGGGDTFGFYQQSEVIYGAILNDPMNGFRLLFSNGYHTEEIIRYSSHIYWFGPNSEFFLIQVVAFFSLLTFHTYVPIALFFAFFSFIGAWLMFSVLRKRYGGIDLWLAIGILFIPTCIFWGSGILKDTVTLAALSLAFWSFFEIIVNQKFSLTTIIIALFSCWIIFSIKIYVLICFIPAVFIWWYLENIKAIKSKVAKVFIAPLMLLIISALGYLVVSTIADTSQKYKLESIAEWSYITSYDIGFFTGKDAGSGYDLGVQDGTWENLIKLAPAAINVSLFRPYLWEIRNPLMLLSAIESFFILLLTIGSLLKIHQKHFRKQLTDPIVIAFLIFSLTFAFAVGASTYNFGSLSRYKIPLLPFYFSAIIILFNSKRINKLRKQTDID